MRIKIREFYLQKHAQLITQLVPEVPTTFASHWIMLGATAHIQLIIANILMLLPVRLVNTIIAIMIMHLIVIYKFRQQIFVL